VSPVHYRPAYEDTGVVCGATPLMYDFTRQFGFVTCFACRNHPTFRLDQLGTDVRPPVRQQMPAMQLLAVIREALDQYDRYIQTSEETILTIKETINRERPDHG
jgi:hypothetical protein